MRIITIIIIILRPIYVIRCVRLVYKYNKIFVYDTRVSAPRDHKKVGRYYSSGTAATVIDCFPM